MSKFARSLFIALGATAAASVLGFVFPPLFLLVLFAVPVEFFVGLLLVFIPERREVGAALLVACGVTLLVAGFVCSSMSYGGFH